MACKQRRQITCAVIRHQGWLRNLRRLSDFGGMQLLLCPSPDLDGCAASVTVASRGRLTGISKPGLRCVRQQEDPMVRSARCKAACVRLLVGDRCVPPTLDQVRRLSFRCRLSRNRRSICFLGPQVCKDCASTSSVHQGNEDYAAAPGPDFRCPNHLFFWIVRAFGEYVWP